MKSRLEQPSFLYEKSISTTKILFRLKRVELFMLKISLIRLYFGKMQRH